MWPVKNTSTYLYLQYVIVFLCKISTEAAYLYDAVHIYARALSKVLDAGDDPYNGTAIIHHAKKYYYKSALG